MIDPKIGVVDADVELSQIIRSLIHLYQQQHNRAVAEKEFALILGISASTSKQVLNLEPVHVVTLAQKLTYKRAFHISCKLDQVSIDELVLRPLFQRSCMGYWSRELLSRLAAICCFNHASSVENDLLFIDKKASETFVIKSADWLSRIAYTLLQDGFVQMNFDHVRVEACIRELRKRRSYEAEKDAAIILGAPDDMIVNLWPEEVKQNVRKRRESLNVEPIKHGRPLKMDVPDMLLFRRIYLEMQAKNIPLLECLCFVMLKMNMELRHVWYTHTNLSKWKWYDLTENLCAIPEPEKVDSQESVA